MDQQQQPVVDDSSYGSSDPIEATSYPSQTPLPEWIGITALCLIVGTIFTLLRFYTRAWIQRTWRWDDSFLLIGWLLALGTSILSFEMMQAESGRYIPTGNLSDSDRELLFSYAVRITYQVSLSLIQLAIAFFYLNCLPRESSRISRWICWTIILIVVVSTVPVVVAMVFQCQPIHDAWSTEEVGSCAVSNRVLAVAAGGVNVVCDVMLVAFVVPMIVMMKTSIKAKIGLLSLVLISALVIAASIVRVMLISRADDDPDASWIYSDIGIWSTISLWSSVFCAAIMALKPLLAKVFPRMFTSRGVEVYSSSDGPYDGWNTRPDSGTARLRQGGSGGGMPVEIKTSHDLYTKDSFSTPTSPAHDVWTPDSKLGMSEPEMRDMNQRHQLPHQSPPQAQNQSQHGLPPNYLLRSDIIKHSDIMASGFGDLSPSSRCSLDGEEENDSEAEGENGDPLHARQVKPHRGAF